MKDSKKQIQSDAAMSSILEANVLRVYEDAENVPDIEQKVLIAGSECGDRRLHVSRQGYVTSAILNRSKKKGDGA